MIILILNSGSSSVKYQLWDTENGGMKAKGLVSRIGIDGPMLEHYVGGKKYKFTPNEIIDHKKGIELALNALVDSEYGVLENIDSIEAVGHRVVHGGEAFAKSALIDDEVIKAIRECIPLAPLHNPPNLIGIEACKEILKNIPQVAVFDTAFHQTMEPYAYIYAIPYEMYEKYRIRRYGFHGTSHYYVANRAAEMLGQPIEKLKIITAHLGNGASIAAVDGGKSVDTSMGFTPLEGLVMGTRCGDIDPAVVLFIIKQTELSPQETDNLLNKKSGLRGISGVSSDFRDILEAAASGNERAKLARDVYVYRIGKYIGAYIAAMGGADAVVFTAGAGENSPILRKMVLEKLNFFGLEIDDEKNEAAVGVEADISSESAKIKTLVIPTNEELVIAQETERIVGKIL
ncbi:acetate kinase [bacterium]|nr:acetate kinase [bacterium]